MAKALGGNGADVTSAVLGGKVPSGDAAVTGFVRDALYAAAHHVFGGLVVVAVLGAAAVLLMPRHTRELVFDDAVPDDAH